MCTRNYRRQLMFLCLREGAFTNISPAYGSIPCNAITLWIRTGFQLRALSLECGAVLERANTGMILMAQICRSACGGASGTAQLVKEKHMMQAV
jgi:hypothetical protein